MTFSRVAWPPVGDRTYPEPKPPPLPDPVAVLDPNQLAREIATEPAPNCATRREAVPKARSEFADDQCAFGQEVTDMFDPDSASLIK